MVGRAARVLDPSPFEEAAQPPRHMARPGSQSSRVRIGPTLQLLTAPEAFVIGDAAYLEAAGL
jgi:hypothetical protein